MAEKLRKKFLPFSRKKQPKGKWLLDVVPESFPQKREQLVPTINIGVPGEAELLRSGAFRAALHDEFADEAAVRVELVQTSVKRIQQIPILQNRLDRRRGILKVIKPASLVSEANDATSDLMELLRKEGYINE